MEAIYYDNRHWFYINAERWDEESMRNGTFIQYPRLVNAKSSHPGVPIVWDDVTGMTPEQFGAAVSSSITTAAKARSTSAAIALGWLS